MRLAALALPCLLFAAASTGAQTVYRCGTSYSQQPCPGAIAVATDARTAGDAQRAQANAQRDAKLADAMEQQRLAQEARAPRAVVIGGQPAVPQASKAAPIERKLKKGEKPVHFIAVAPRPAGETPASKKAKAKKNN